MERCDIPTDDAESRFYTGCEPFGPGEDRDPMHDDAPNGNGYRCGRGDFRDIPCCVDDDGKFIGPGCRHCNPVDHECKPHGWGFERFESKDVYRLINEWRCNFPVTVGREYPAGPEWFRRACEWTGFNFRLERCSDRMWEKCCNECETHTEAVERYTRWAVKVSKAI